jgi:hypothetical protein
MKNWFNASLQLIRKTGFGWGFVLGGLLMGGMALSLNNAHAQEIMQVNAPERHHWCLFD